MTVVQCQSCGIVQLTGEPVPYYREVIRAAAYSPEMREFRLAQFADWAKRHQLIGKQVLEIGCGRGEYLTLLKACGLDCTGLEYHLGNLEACRAQDFSVFRRYLGDPPETEDALSGVQFDAFVCLNFMEHWPAPSTSLNELHAYLKPGAIGLVEVPNFDMIVQEQLFSEFIADHLFYFTEQTLHNLLEQNGFEVLDIRPVWHQYVLSAEVRKRAPLNLSPLVDQQAQIAHALKAFLSGSTRAAVWGAGHQALAVIALTGIADSLNYVVDSAPFKQGRYTPASHLPVVAPTHLLEDPVDRIVIMAASYSDEVARQVGAMPLAARIAILRHDHLELIE